MATKPVRLSWVFRLEENDVMKEWVVFTAKKLKQQLFPILFQSQRTQIFPLFQRLSPHVFPINSCVEARISKSHDPEPWQNLIQYGIFKKEKNIQQKL